MATKAKTPTKAQIENYHKQLRQRRDELTQSMRTSAASAPKNGLRGGSGDAADLASCDYEAELFGALLEKQAGTLEEVEHALEKIEKGTYGVCETCGDRILAKRLKAIPWAKHCRECQEKKDRLAAMRKTGASSPVWS